ncbi:acyl carrier protein phosphodiesterase [Chitinophaga horti]|uniref:Acyl carrier protein phosphodiesterase n=1 Tax=Chitinophaga horti TaxID=2920382 RepID=A0ABY6IYS6_9BACT|nr:acyl carrier protein phosphodiesterase [Chitinophaga horti]UYQ92541.1 acyl carrier protein phosphodiesterase [Chitinophaga horti]
MIADFVKGKQLLQYPPDVQQGVRLHRAIDAYTDHHPATARAKNCLKPAVGAYSAVYTDIIYDHFLANDPEHFTAQSLETFAGGIYETLAAHHDQLPPVFQQVFSYMRQHNWLLHYRERNGIASSFNGITRRAKYQQVPATVPFKAFEDHYDTLKDCYAQFFPDLLRYVKSYLEAPGGAEPSF